jgi:hypothetical protein
LDISHEEASLTQDQFLMGIRMFLQIAGSFLISKNLFTDADWTAFAGAIMTIAGIGWTMWARRETALKQTVAAMPNTVVVTHASGAGDAVTTQIATIPGVKDVAST